MLLFCQLGPGQGGFLAIECAWCVRACSPAELLSYLLVRVAGSSRVLPSASQAPGQEASRAWAQQAAARAHSSDLAVPACRKQPCAPVVWQCSLQQPASEACREHRQCGLLRFGPISMSPACGNSNLCDQPGRGCLLPPACPWHCCVLGRRGIASLQLGQHKPGSPCPSHQLRPRCCACWFFPAWGGTQRWQQGQQGLGSDGHGVGCSGGFSPTPELQQVRVAL